MKKTYYSTRDALSKGIQKFIPSTPPSKAVVDGKDTFYVNHNGTYLVLGKNCFETKEEAVDTAEEMRIKKLQELDNEFKRISAIDFGDIQ